MPLLKPHFWKAIAAMGLGIFATTQAVAQEPDNTMSWLTGEDPGRLADFGRLPALSGGGLRIGSATIGRTLRPVTALPPAATGPVVLDTASNRFVYFDGTNTLLSPGNGAITDTFIFYQAPGGGLLTQTTDAQGTVGFFGLERVTVNPMNSTTVIEPSFDLLVQPGTATVTDPIMGSMFTSPLQAPHLSLRPTTIGNPSLSNVGLNRLADGGSPVPQDRVFMNYSLFDNAALGQGQSLNRFTPGIEKALFGGQASVEFRMPFAATLDQSQRLNGATSTDAVEFGDLNLIFKSVIAEGGSWLVSGGLQMTIPTADDYVWRVTDRGQSADFLELENDTVHLMPFVTGAWVSERWFAQGMVQFDFVAHGRTVSVNTNGLNGGRLSEVGRLNDGSFVYLDTNLGYWLKQDAAESTDFFTGIAPVWDLHYLRTVSDLDSVSFAPNGAIGRAGEYEIVTTSLGCLFEIRHQSQLLLTYSTPIGGGVDRDFDGELRVMLTHRFGR